MNELAIPDIYLTTFATKDFQPYQEELIESAKHYGIYKGFKFTEEDLVSSVFYEKNKKIFSYSRGFGFWLWKPYFILEALKKVAENEIVFYVDSGALFINDPQPLIEIARDNKTGLVVFDHRPVKSSEFTKRDTFINLNCDTEEFWNANIIMAGIMLVRKNETTLKFISEWLNECENIHSISDLPNIHGKNNLPGFRTHREDQSIFSILIKKYGIETYRDPSKWGNYLKLPQFRYPGELVCYPWQMNDSIKTYSDTPTQNSPYDTIFELNRKQIREGLGAKKQTIYERFLNKFIPKQRRKVQ